MGEKLTDNNLDKLFRDSIDNMETQPSEAFWVKASEDSLYKSNIVTRKAVERWKIVALTLGIAVVALSAYLIYMQRQISDINKRLATTENKNSFQTDAKSTPAYNQQRGAASGVAKNNQTVANQRTTVAISPPNNANKTVISHISEKQVAAQTKSFAKPGNSKTHVAQPVGNISYTHIGNNSEISKNYFSQESSPNNIGSAITQDAPKSNSSELLFGISNFSLLQINNSETSILPDTIVPVQNYARPAGHNILSRLSVSLFYEPYMSDELFENESSDIVTVNNVSANEEEVHPYMIGLRMGYDISKHWTITTGCFFYNFNVSVSPTTIYAQKQGDGTVGYSFQTSIGAVSCPYGATPKVGDYMIVSGEEFANYISVPLQVKYNFITKSRWGVYISAGLMANIVAYREMNMHWQDYKWNEGNASEGIDNSQKVYGSYYFAPGISYRLFNKCSLFFEPSLQGSPVYSSVLNTTPYIGLGAGIIYHL
ncbi:MAG: hypothetical protein ACLQQ4_10505 [Bacteroidia bacterium]